MKTRIMLLFLSGLFPLAPQVVDVTRMENQIGAGQSYLDLPQNRQIRQPPIRAPLKQWGDREAQRVEATTLSPGQLWDARGQPLEKVLWPTGWSETAAAEILGSGLSFMAAVFLWVMFNNRQKGFALNPLSLEDKKPSGQQAQTGPRGYFDKIFDIYSQVRVAGEALKLKKQRKRSNQLMELTKLKFTLVETGGEQAWDDIRGSIIGVGTGGCEAATDKFIFLNQWLATLGSDQAGAFASRLALTLLETNDETVMRCSRKLERIPGRRQHVIIGRDRLKGYGGGKNFAEVARAAEESMGEINSALERLLGAVHFIYGSGGKSTGTVVMPIICELLRGAGETVIPCFIEPVEQQVGRGQMQIADNMYRELNSKGATLCIRNRELMNDPIATDERRKFEQANRLIARGTGFVPIALAESREIDRADLGLNFLSAGAQICATEASVMLNEYLADPAALTAAVDRLLQPPPNYFRYDANGGKDGSVAVGIALHANLGLKNRIRGEVVQRLEGLLGGGCNIFTFSSPGPADRILLGALRSNQSRRPENKSEMPALTLRPLQRRKSPPWTAAAANDYVPAAKAPAELTHTPELPPQLPASTPVETPVLKPAATNAPITQPAPAAACTNVPAAVPAPAPPLCSAAQLLKAARVEKHAHHALAVRLLTQGSPEDLDFGLTHEKPDILVDGLLEFKKSLCSPTEFWNYSPEWTEAWLAGLIQSNLCLTEAISVKLIKLFGSESLQRFSPEQTNGSAQTAGKGRRLWRLLERGNDKFQGLVTPRAQADS